MLGEILQALADPDRADSLLANLAGSELRQRIERTAAANNVAVGEVVAGRIRHYLDHGSEDVWLDLIEAMSGSPQPGVAAVERILARAFPVERRALQPNKSRRG